MPVCVIINIQGDDELVADQGVTTRFFSTSNSDPSAPKVELLEPTGEDTPIGKFLSKRGPGVQQVCFRVENIESIIAWCTSRVVMSVYSTYRTKIVFSSFRVKLIK